MLEKETKSIGCGQYLQQASLERPQGLILAAGRGGRLGTRVEEFPKCLLQVGGKSLLEHQLMMFHAAGISDVCVVAGYHRRIVAEACRGRAHVIENIDWATTNSLYSLSLASAWVDRSLVVVNCDVLLEPIVVTQLIRNGVSRFAIDSSSGGDEEHMKVQLSDGYLVSMSKTLDDANVHGENVGILHFSARDARKLFSCVGTALNRGGQSQWMAAAMELLARKVNIEALDISDLAWIEIDYAEDLSRARKKIWPLIERRRLPRVNATKGTERLSPAVDSCEE